MNASAKSIHSNSEQTNVHTKICIEMKYFIRGTWIKENTNYPHSRSHSRQFFPDHWNLMHVISNIFFVVINVPCDSMFIDYASINCAKCILNVSKRWLMKYTIQNTVQQNRTHIIIHWNSERTRSKRMAFMLTRRKI